jgi:hypothetical protein
MNSLAICDSGLTSRGFNFNPLFHFSSNANTETLERRDEADGRLGRTLFPELTISLHETVSNNWNAPSPAQLLTKIFSSSHVQLTPTKTGSDWTHAVRQACALGIEDEALKRVAMEAAITKANGEFSRLSDELSQLNLTQLPTVVLVALVRNTFSFRAHLPSWENLLESVEKTLSARGKEPRLLLRGLKRG